MHHSIAVITHQAASICTNPEETIGIRVKRTNIIMRQPVAQIQISQVITLRQKVPTTETDQ